MNLLPLNWSDPKRVNTRNGERDLRTAPPNETFWSLWKSQKAELKNNGYSVTMSNGSWVVQHWGTVVLSEQEKVAKETALEASRATDAEVVIPSPPGWDYRPFQRAGIAFARNHNAVLLGDDMGLGKAQPLTAKILTPTGWITMAEAKIGTDIIGSDGQIHTITGVFPQGVKPAYRVTFSDGSSTECCNEHLWQVTDPNERTQVLSVREMMDRGLQYASGANKYRIPIMQPAMFVEETPLPIDPYVLGVLIGDGYLKGTSIDFSVPPSKEPILKRVQKVYPDRVTGPFGNGTSVQYRIIGTEHKRNDVLNDVRLLGLNIPSKERFIPMIYKFASVEHRIELLRGLMDTDGSASKNRITYHTCSERLAQDVVGLVRSLGGVAILREYDRTAEGKSVEWQINVRVKFCPFTLDYKKSEWSPADYIAGKKIVSIEYIDNVEQQCISVSAPDRLYVTDDYLVTHNTVQVIGIANDSKAKTVLIICPASLRVNWFKELKRWLVDTSLRIDVMSTTKKKFTFEGQTYTTTTEWPKDPNVVIINYDIASRFTRELRSVDWDLAGFDEAHMLKNNKTKRTKAIFGFKDRKTGEELGPINAKIRVCATGTPIPNRPIEIYPILHFLDPTNWKNVHKFALRYCAASHNGYGWDYSGASNLDELQDKLRSTMMIRRLKKDVLTELPPKTRQLIAVPEELQTKEAKEQNKRQEHYKKIIDKARADMLLALASEDDNAYMNAVKRLKQASQAAFEEMARLRKATAVSKIPFVIEHVQNASDKVIIMCHHHEVVDGLAEALGKDQCVTLTGRDGITKRDEAVTKFQTDESIRYFIGSIQAAGVGLTLTRSSHVVFAELDWVPGNVTQAEDRCILEGQPILTPYGWRPIESIEKDDYVITHTGQAHKVTDTWSKSNRKITVELNLEGWLDTIKVTNDHRILTDRGWIEAQQLIPGDRVAMPVLQDVPELTEISFPEECRLPTEFNGAGGIQTNGRLITLPESIKLTDDALFSFGYYIGDGFCRTDGSKSSRFVSIAGNPGKKAEAMERVEHWFGEINCHKREVDNEREWRFFSGEWALWFAKEFGRTGPEKRIPEWVFSCSRHQRKQLLDGMMASDGYHRNTRFEYITMNADLAAQTARLMLACGFKPCVTKGTTDQWVIAYSEQTEPWLNVERVTLRHGKKSEKVFDLTVEHDSSFVIGTAVVHNCHRIGQTNNVLIQHIVFDGTIDCRMTELLIEKQANIDAALDTKHEKTEVVEATAETTEDFDVEDVWAKAEQALKDAQIRRIELQQMTEKETLDRRRQGYIERAEGKVDLELIFEFTDDQIAAIHSGLRTLAACDQDRASEENFVGYSKADSYLGHALANLGHLSPKQAYLGRVLCQKYRGQLGEGFVKQMF